MTEKKILIIIQARLSSTRLPKKVLLDLLGKPLLIRMIERVKLSNLASKVVVATTSNSEDDELVDLCKINNINCFRGSSLDLLDRHYNCAKKEKADIILKIPSDCPLIDPKVIDRVIFNHLKGEFDYTSNLHPQSYPDGQDVEVINFSALEKVWEQAKKPYEREHTTPYIWENKSKFRLNNVLWEKGIDLSMIYRIVLDYYEDYQLIKSVFENLYLKNPMFDINEIVSFLDNNPEITKLNKKYIGVNWYRNHLDELKTINPSDTKII